MMKIFARVIAVLLLLTVCAAVVTACGKDKEPEPTSAPAATAPPATQKPVETVANTDPATADEAPGYFDEELIGTWIDQEKGVTVIFKEDYTFSIALDSPAFKMSGTYKIPIENGGKIDLKIKGSAKAERFTYAVTGNTIKLSGHTTYAGLGDVNFSGKKQ